MKAWAPRSDSDAMGAPSSAASDVCNSNPFNPRSNTRWNGNIWNAGSGGGWVPVGGLDSTGSNLNTWRNVLDQSTLSTGGRAGLGSSPPPTTWTPFAGSAFNIMAIDSITSSNHFSDVHTFLTDAAKQHLTQITPDLTTLYWWGDDASPDHKSLARMASPTNLQSLLMLLTGIAQGMTPSSRI